MAIAIVAALTSLFAITLSTRAGSGTTRTTQSAPASAFTPQMMNLSLPDAAGKQVNLQKSVPVVILILDGCSCSQLIRDTVTAAPAKVHVFVVDRNAPPLPDGVTATALADRQQALLATYGAGPDRNGRQAGQVTAVLVDSSDNVTRTFSHANAISDFREALTALR